MPASPMNRTVIEIAVYPNPKRLSVDTFCITYCERLGWSISVDNLKQGYESSLPAYSVHLLNESTEVVYVPIRNTGQEFFVISPLQQEYIYLVGQGYMTGGDMQTQIFHLFIENFHLR
jgi:hypothetical protein